MSVRVAACRLLWTGLLAAMAAGIPAGGGAWAEPIDDVRAGFGGAVALRAAFDEVLPEPAAEPSAELAGSPDPVPSATEPVETGSIAVPAEPPLAPVTFTQAEILAGAIETRLADPKLPLPPRLSRRDRDALAAFYKAASHRPLWLADRDWTSQARGLTARLALAAEDALDPAAYPIPALAPAGRAFTPADLAEAELKLSAAAFLYARDARGGRLDPARLSPNMTPTLDLPPLAAVLAPLAGADDPGEVLLAFNPAYPGYRALRRKLADLRSNRPAGPLVASGRPTADRRASAVRSIAIISDMDEPPPSPAPPGGARLEADIVANMERWRWLPATVAPRYVAVNVPEFQLRLMEGGHVALEARVITGKPDTPTPIVSGELDRAVVNPSWHIPPSIMKNEILPGLARDPGYAARRGYEVIRRGDVVSVRQPPGERNALGFIKFLFPNNHAVYLHDTPNRNLFASGRRAFSHGCVRVDQPFRLAEAVLGREWSEPRLKRLIGQGERAIRLPEKLPVHLTYFTVEADGYGGVRTFEDLYGYHRRVRVALGLGA